MPDKDENEKVDVDSLSVEEQLEHYKQKTAYWKSQSRKNENEKNQNKELAQKWTEYEASQKPTEEQLLTQLNDLKTQIAQKDREVLLNKLITTNGLKAESSDFISGNTEEEILESIAKFKNVTGYTESKDEAKPLAPNPLQGFVSEPVEKQETALEKAFREQLKPTDNS